MISPPGLRKRYSVIIVGSLQPFLHGTSPGAAIFIIIYILLLLDPVSRTSIHHLIFKADLGRSCSRCYDTRMRWAIPLLLASLLLGAGACSVPWLGDRGGAGGGGGRLV